MPGVLEYIFSLDTDSQGRLINQLRLKPEEQEAGDRELLEQMGRELMQLAHTPIEMTPPRLHSLRRKAQLYWVPMVANNGIFPPEWEESKRQEAEKDLIYLLRPYPALQAVQREISELLMVNGEPQFELPPFLNEIDKHLGRPERFLVVRFYAPTLAQMTAQLTDLHTRKPDVHMRLLLLLLRAAIDGQPPHAKDCACLLCAHAAKVTALSSASSNASKSA